MEYTHKEVLRVFPKVNGRTLISWSERGLIHPEHGDASGPGTRRQYSFKNLIEIGIIKEMESYSLPFRTIRRVLNIYDEGVFSHYRNNLVITFGKTVDGHKDEGLQIGLHHYSDFENVKDLGKLLLGTHPLFPKAGITFPLVSSVIVINVAAIWGYVEKALKA